MAIKLILKTCLLLALVAAVEGVMFLHPLKSAASRNSYLDVWGTKHQHLVGPGHNRLILAGGSNVAFGVDSSALQAVTQREILNLGLHGGLGLALMLNEVEAGARAGDVVVLFPEYELFFGDLMYGDSTAANLMRSDRSALRYFSSWRQWKSLVKGVVTMNATAAMAMLDQGKALVPYPGRQHDTPSVGTPSVYRSDAFDGHGDVVAHLNLDSETHKVVASAARIKGKLNDDAIRAIERCAAILAHRGVNFLVIYPPVAASHWAINRDLAQRVAARLPEQLTRTRPEDWVFADEWFYNTAYHLNRVGRDVRTKRLARVLRDAASGRVVER
jgi:hypothetical protein